MNEESNYKASWGWLISVCIAVVDAENIVKHLRSVWNIKNVLLESIRMQNKWPDQIDGHMNAHQQFKTKTVRKLMEIEPSRLMMIMYEEKEKYIKVD